MIRLHHFGHGDRSFYLNPDLILMVESKPDTIIHLTNGHEMYVADTPQEICAAILDWRAEIIRRGNTPKLVSADGEVRHDG